MTEPVNNSRNNANEIPKYFTNDFINMISIVKFTSLGFFFLEFIVPYVASQLLDATGFQMGIIFSVQIFGYLICSTFVGIISDRVKSKSWLIFLGASGRGIAYFILYSGIVFRSLIGVAIGTFSIGLLVGFFWIPLDSLIAEKSSKNHRSLAYGMRNSAQGKGIMLGAILGFSIFGFANEMYPGNLVIIFLALPLFGLANIYAGLRFMHDVDENIVYSSENDTNESINDKTNVPFLLFSGLLLLLFSIFLSNVNGSLAKPFLQIYLLENIENDANLAVMAYVPAGIISMLLAPKVGNFIDNINPSVGISIASFLGAIITLLLINTNSLVVFSGLLILDSTCGAVSGLSIQNIFSRVSQKNRGKIFGLSAFFSNLGAVFGPLFGGIIWDVYGMKSPFLFSIFVELLLIPIYLAAIHTLKPQLAEKNEND